jgi:hypothetical protein
MTVQGDNERPALETRWPFFARGYCTDKGRLSLDSLWIAFVVVASGAERTPIASGSKPESEQDAPRRATCLVHVNGGYRHRTRYEFRSFASSASTSA